ncbi:MAG: penicillin-binding transpeptidase domain-containing protein [Nitriliruptoraceae bacterium]
MRYGQIFAAIVGVAIVVVAAVTGLNWVRTLVTDTSVPQDHAATAAAAYLEAWEAADYAQMLELVRSAPDDFTARHEQMMTGLAPTRLQLDTGAPTGDVDGLRDFPVEVRIEVDGLTDPITWSTNLRLVRERGQWGVAWNLATIHPELRPTWEFGFETEQVERAPILAHDGRQIAGDGVTVSLGFEPSAVTDPEALIAAFESALPGTGRLAERELGRRNLVDGWFYPVTTVSLQRADEVWDQIRPVPGALRRQLEDRAVFGPSFAQHTVGVVSEATAEQLTQLGDAAEPGILIAQYGLEREFDEQLEGTEIVRVGLREVEGGPLRHIISTLQDDPAEPLITTLDIEIQTAVETAISAAPSPAAIVVIDASDGAIRGAASRPLGGYHRAFDGRYPPGSTFKIVTAEALLAAGHGLTDTVACPSEASVGGLRIGNAGGFSLDGIDLAQSFAASCNTTFAVLGAGVGTTALTDAARRFGFGVELDLGLSAFGGSFPTPADTAEAGAASFGQARVEASVVHMASVAAATEVGAWHQPYLIANRRPAMSTVLTPRSVDGLRQMMRLAVTDGTGTAAGVDGTEIGGKTGTAQGPGGVEHAWFVGTYNGLGFAILVEEGGSGGQVAAPVARHLVEQLIAQAASN